MSPRCLFRLAVASATAAAGLAFGAPASATVTYDSATQIGFVDRDDVRTAFGWTDVTLASRASEVAFDHDFWTEDTYSVSCGGSAFDVVHSREAGRMFLTAAPVSHRDRGAAGYHGKLIGFRLTGAYAGISATGPPPAAGQPCPRDQAPSPTIDKARMVSSATGWALIVRFGDVRRELLTGVR
jgi:hypothetical protein